MAVGIPSIEDEEQKIAYLLAIVVGANSEDEIVRLRNELIEKAEDFSKTLFQKASDFINEKESNLDPASLRKLEILVHGFTA